MYLERQGLFLLQRTGEAGASRDANGNSEALELPDAEYIYGVCENGDTLAVLAGAAPLFFAGTGDEQTGNGDHAIYLYDETGKLTGSIPTGRVLHRCALCAG